MEKSNKRQKAKKEIKYSFLQTILNCWTLPILLRWSQPELEMEDIPPIYTKSEAVLLGDDISKLWESEVKDPGRGWGLWKVLLKKFGGSFFFVLALLIFQQCALRLALPVFLGLLIRFLDGHFSWRFGYFFGAAFALTVFLSSLIFHPCIFELQKLGMQIRIGLTNLIYKKVLRLNQKSLAESGIGQLTNILSNDVNRFDDVMEFIPFVIIGPCQIIFVTIILWNYTGPSCVPGLALLLLLMPIQGFLGKEFGHLRMKVAEITDRRVRCLTELLSGMLLIKMSAWEDTYAENVQQIRKKELIKIQRKNRFAGFNYSLFAVSTKMSILLTFLTFILTDHELSTESVFVTLSMYNIIALTIGMFLPNGISGLSELVVSMSRIQAILLLEENEVSEPVMPLDEFVPLVELRNVSGSWGNGNETIKDISFRAQSGELIGIIGSVGSGKSSILQAILHELPMENPDSVMVLGSIAYASQEPCLFPDSIRNNILLGRDYDETWYLQVVDACGLTSDLAMFPFGDETLVGDKGVTLSGGQKARVNLARAVYSRADIYLLDDPLSALDVRVARHVKEKCIDGLLRDKCVILVTHQTHFLRERVNKVISVEKGQITRHGVYEEVFGDGNAGGEDQHAEPDTIAINDIELAPEGGEGPHAPDLRKGSLQGFAIEESEVSGKLKPKAEQELRRQGSVGWNLFWTYFKAGNSYCSLCVLLFLAIFAQVLQNGSDIWLKIWANKENGNPFPSPGGATTSFPYLPSLPHHLEYVELYAGLVALFFVVSLSRTLTIFSTLLSSGRKLHAKLFTAILKAPMSFFQVNSEGLILKLFSNDVGVMDERLPMLMYNVIGTTFQVLGSMTVVSLMSPLLILPTLLLILVIYLIQRIYIRSSGSLKRIEGIARSPVFGQLTTTLSGLPTIRAFKTQPYFYTQFVQAQDRHSSAFFLYLASFRWLTMTLELVADLYINLVMVYLLATNADSAAFGLALTAALCIINDGTGMVMFSAQLINQMISIERILDYTEIEAEELPGRSQNGGELVDPSWPRNGDVEFEKVTVAYKNGPNILEDVTLKIKDSEKIGIIGRTGAGKTTLVGALFRIVQPIDGEIRIAGRATQNLPLKSLRVKLSIIPQNPVLLAGTLRRNLDPFNEYSDARIWEVLEVVQLKMRMVESGQGLSYELSEGGLNFSQGERQLISLARTILRQNKILVLDEATANIDTKTDAIIQQAIRERFKNSTVLTIAHRLETVMDSDRILVLDGGRIREFDTPSTLLSNQDSFLFQLVQKSGERNAAKLMGMIKQPS